MSEIDRRPNDQIVGGAGFEFLDEGTVDLDFVGRQPPQVGRRGVPGPEVIDRKADTEHAQPFHHAERIREVLHRAALRYLEHHLGGVGAGREQQPLDRVGEIRVGRIHRRNVDRDV
jgi:hypothetical protein